MKDQTNKVNVEESEFFVNESSSMHEPLLPGDVVGEFVCQGIDGEHGNIQTFSSQDLINNHSIFVFYRSNFTETSTELINMFYSCQWSRTLHGLIKTGNQSFPSMSSPTKLVNSARSLEFSTMITTLLATQLSSSTRMAKLKDLWCLERREISQVLWIMPSRFLNL